MILRNVTFRNELAFYEDHVYTIEVTSPTLFGRFVMSMLSLEAGEVPIEQFAFYDGDKQLNAEKMLTVVPDPFHIDFNSRKSLNSLYAKLESMLLADPEKHMEWLRLSSNLEEIAKSLCMNIASEVDIPNTELTLAEYCRSMDYKFMCSADSTPLQRLCSLMDMMAEFTPHKLLVVCNIAPYFSDNDRIELLKYACYTKITFLEIELSLPKAMYEHEIRWIIHPDYDDEIRYS